MHGARVQLWHMACLKRASAFSCILPLHKSLCQPPVHSVNDIFYLHCRRKHTWSLLIILTCNNDPTSSYLSRLVLAEKKSILLDSHQVKKFQNIYLVSAAKIKQDWKIGQINWHVEIRLFWSICHNLGSKYLYLFILMYLFLPYWFIMFDIINIL